ncbi:MAG TPA: hypothetical protein VGD78_00915 [Chthoniobacterales bacterium]
MPLREGLNLFRLLRLYFIRRFSPLSSLWDILKVSEVKGREDRFGRLSAVFPRLIYWKHQGK